MKRGIGILLVAAISILTSHFAWGSGGSIISSGALENTIGGATGNREWIILEKSGELLKGIPRSRHIEMITIFAPGLQKSHLILREMKLKNGQESILISAPSELQREIIRATIFFKAFKDNTTLYEYIDGNWIIRHPIWLPIHNDCPMSIRDNNSLWAYPVNRFGYYCIGKITPKSTKDPAETVGHFDTSILPGGNIQRGFYPLIWAGFLVIIWGAISCIIHRIERNRGY